MSQSRLWATITAAIGVGLTVAGLTVALGAPSSAARANRLYEGKGYTAAHGDFVGFYLTESGTKVYCLSPRKALPSSVRMTRTGRYRGVSASVSDELAYALRHWGDASTRYGAAAESQLLNTIVGNTVDVAARARQLPAPIAELVRQRLALTRHQHGPYVTTLRIPRASLPGQSGVGSVVVGSAAQRRVGGVSVTLTATNNVSVPRRITIGANGIGRFTYRVRDVGAVRIVATALGLASTSLLVNHPTSSQQRMVTWSPATTSRASVHLQHTPGGFADRYSCTTTCNGRPAVTLRVCAPASSYPGRIAYHHASRVVYVTFPAARSVSCRSRSVVMADGAHVWARWQYRTPHGWSRPVAAPGAFVVDCPAVPAVAVTMSYDCTAASVTVALARRGADGSWARLVNASTHRMVLVIGGAASHRIYADRDQSATFTAGATCGSPVTFTARAGVQRAGGRFNYGEMASVTTPG